MIDWEWVGVSPPKVGDSVQFEFDDAIVQTEVAILIDGEGDETDDPEMCYVAICKEVDSDGYYVADFAKAFLNDKAGDVATVN